MNNVYLLLGSNEGNRMDWFQKAIEQIEACCGMIVKKSSVYETKAWGITTQPDFLNMVIQLETEISPEELLAALINIEISLGRKRDIKWGPRLIDIDILLFNNEVIDTPRLIVPHPFLHLRRFTLAPLAEIAPYYIHPVLHKTIAQLLTVSPDNLEVHLKIGS